MAPQVWPETKNTGKDAKHYDVVDWRPRLSAIGAVVCAVVPEHAPGPRLHFLDCLVAMLAADRDQRRHR